MVVVVDNNGLWAGFGREDLRGGDLPIGFAGVDDEFAHALPYFLFAVWSCERRIVLTALLCQERHEETPDVVELRKDCGALFFQEGDAGFERRTGDCGEFRTGFAKELRGRRRQGLAAKEVVEGDTE